MIELKEIVSGKWIITQSGYCRSRLTDRWYKETRDIQNYCIMSEEEAKLIYELLKLKDTL